MQAHLFAPRDMNPEFWRIFSEMRNADPAYDDPFFDPFFARILADVRPDTRIAVAFGEDLTGPIAFWPMHVRPDGWARPIGGPFSDWHGPIVKPGTAIDPAAFLAAAGLSGFTAFGMPAALSHGHLTERAGSNMVDVSMGWDAYAAQQSKLYPKHFKKMRRVRRNADRDFSEIRFDFDDISRDAFDWLINRKRQQFLKTGRHDVLSSKWARRMLERLRGHYSPRLSAHLMTLRFDGRVAAAEFNLLSDTTIHGWIIAYDPELSYYAPGYMLQHEILRRMGELGRTTYDFGPGLDYYKKYYTNYQLPLDTGVLRPNAAPGFHRLMAGSWRAAEQIMPGPAGRLMGKVRRRTDQIVMSETSFTGRLGGIARALRPGAK